MKGVAASAALPIAAGMGGAADDGDYEEIVVGRNDRFTKTLSNGETWGNVVIDISAPGAKFRIRAIGDDWTVRNVGIRGVWDDPAKEEPFIASGNGRIENFYWADGTNWTAGGGAATGIFVPASHSGRIVMENLNLQDFGDNGVYASAPGNGSEHSAPGGGGEVIIRNSYAANCTPAGFRLGTDGSKLENCVMYRNLRNFWAFYEHTEVVDCDMSNADGTGDISQRGGIGDIVLGDSAWTKSNHAEVTAKNSYWERAGAHGGASTANVHGSPVDRSPRTKPEEVERVPLSAEEAASGTSSGSSSSPSPPADEEDIDDSDEGEDVETDEHLLAFITETEAEYAEYELVAEGELTPTEAPYESPSGARIAADRETVNEEDGVYSVSSLTGGGFGDAYLVDGPITHIEIEQPDVMWLELDGEEMTVEEIIEKTATDGDGDDSDDATEEEDGESATNERSSRSLEEFFADWDNVHICRWNR